MKVYQTEPQLFKWFEFLNQDDINVEKFNENDMKLFGSRNEERKKSREKTVMRDNLLLKNINELEAQVGHCITLLQNSIFLFLIKECDYFKKMKEKNSIVSSASIISDNPLLSKKTSFIEKDKSQNNQIKGKYTVHQGFFLSFVLN